MVQIPGAQIRDTVAAVFRDGAYQNATVLERVIAWIVDLLSALGLLVEPGHVPEAILWILLFVAVALLAVPVVKTVVLMRTDPERTRDGTPGTRAFGRDPWRAAAQFAARGDYTAAAHATYAALLEAFAGRGEVELHESKTIGDYRRDLTRASSSALLSFRAFARDYETVIYGIGSCDRERYEQLHGLARSLVEADG